MKRCWIYCGVPLHTSLDIMGWKRDKLRQYALNQNYTVVGFTSENINETFVQSNGALTVLKGITQKQFDILVIEKGILDHSDLTIQTFFEYAKEHGVCIDEIEIGNKEIVE